MLALTTYTSKQHISITSVSLTHNILHPVTPFSHSQRPASSEAPMPIRCHPLFPYPLEEGHHNPPML